MASIDSFIGIGILSFFILIGILILGSIILWLWMLIDALKRDFRKDSDKIVWIIVMLLLGVIGSLLYLFIVYLPERKKQ